MYQRNIKLYQGIDNIIEFDVKNNDQKRIDLSSLSNLQLNLMDESNTSLPNSPYNLVNTQTKGIASLTIPQNDLNDLDYPQFLKYSISAIHNGNDILLYCNTNFDAIGTAELIGNALPTYRNPLIYNTFTGEIDYNGNVINHSSAIPATFYESVPTSQLSFIITLNEFVGTVYLEGTKTQTISISSFQHAQQLYSYSTTIPTTTTITFNNVPVADWIYFRISWINGTYHGTTGTVNSIIVE